MTSNKKTKSEKTVELEPIEQIRRWFLRTSVLNRLTTYKMEFQAWKGGRDQEETTEALLEIQFAENQIERLTQELNNAIDEHKALIASRAAFLAHLDRKYYNVIQH